MRNQTSTGSHRNQTQWTILRLLTWTTSYFKSHDIESPRTDAEILLAHVLEANRIDLYLRYDQPLNKDELAHFKTLIKRRTAYEPVAYIVGEKEFWSMGLTVTPAVLIPRPETECLVETVLNVLTSDPETGKGSVLELGTGSGAISIALASRLPAYRIYASDRSHCALMTARENALRYLPPDRICFFIGDWLGPLNPNREGFDAIVSNPPYIARAVLEGLQPEITRHEPRLALDGGEDGLDSIRSIILAAGNHLVPGGNLFLEIGYDQKKAVEDIFESSESFETIIFSKDYSGHTRVARLVKAA